MQVKGLECSTFNAYQNVGMHVFPKGSEEMHVYITEILR
jgi:hypothetical protein